MYQKADNTLALTPSTPWRQMPWGPLGLAPHLSNDVMKGLRGCPFGIWALCSL